MISARAAALWLVEGHQIRRGIYIQCCTVHERGMLEFFFFFFFFFRFILHGSLRLKASSMLEPYSEWPSDILRNLLYPARLS